MDFKKTVAIHYTEFTPSERKICARILEDPQIVNNSIVVLGDLCETSKSAILRFKSLDTVDTQNSNILLKKVLKITMKKNSATNHY